MRGCPPLPQEAPMFPRFAARTALTTAAVLAVGATAATAAPTGISVPEGDSGLTSVTVPVDLAIPALIPRAAGYETVAGTAHAGDDYEALAGTLIFVPLQTHRDLVVNVKGDTVHEADETFTVHVGGVAAFDQAITIVDDDPAPQPPAPPSDPPAEPAAPSAPPVEQQSRVEVHVGPGVSIAEPRRRSRGLDGRRVRLQLTCPKAAECPGGLTLRWGAKKAGGASFLLNKGTRRTLAVRLSPEAWRSLRRHHRLRLVARLESGRTLRFTVKR